LKKFLKKQGIPPKTVNGVTLQIRHDDDGGAPMPEPAGPPVGGDSPAVVGLIFKGIPKNILSDDHALYTMEDSVFEGHPIALMEPVEEDQHIRITLSHPIYDQSELQTLAQRLKKFLASKRVTQQKKSTTSW